MEKHSNNITLHYTVSLTANKEHYTLMQMHTHSLLYVNLNLLSDCYDTHLNTFRLENELARLIQTERLLGCLFYKTTTTSLGNNESRIKSDENVSSSRFWSMDNCGEFIIL